MRTRSGTRPRTLAAAILAVLLLASCATPHHHHSILDRERNADDELPRHVLAELNNVNANLDSSRLAGTDSAGGRYYVTEGRENDSFCLVMILGDGGDEWVQGCGRLPLKVALPKHRAMATLFAEPATATREIEEMVGDHIVVIRN